MAARAVFAVELLSGGLEFAPRISKHSIDMTLEVVLALEKPVVGFITLSPDGSMAL